MSLIQLNERILSSTNYLDTKYTYNSNYNKFKFTKPKYQKLIDRLASYKAPGINHEVNHDDCNSKEIENETIDQDVDDFNESFAYQMQSQEEEL